jgi:hypothetical protein
LLDVGCVGCLVCDERGGEEEAFVAVAGEKERDVVVEAVLREEFGGEVGDQRPVDYRAVGEESVE